MKYLKLKSLLPVTAALALAACGNADRWHVNGIIDGAEGQLLTLEGSHNGKWYVLDSIRLDASGNFDFAQEPAGYPDIYRLTIDNRSLYFPIDSINTITVNAARDDFDNQYTVSGSRSADMLQEVNEKISASIAANGIEGALNDRLMKRELSELILGDQSGVVSYYIINKKIGDSRLFNPADNADLRIIGAVANAFTNFRPEDPRTDYIKNLYLGYRYAMSMPNDTLEVTEINYHDIKLLDEKGNSRALSDIVGKGKPVVVNFTTYAAEESPAFNIELAKAYEAGNIEIYQVSLDTDEFMWRETAKNLPWITVLNSPKDGTRNLINYNIGALPATFIIDRAGMLSERVNDITKLRESVAKTR